MNENTKRLVLASKSISRRQILTNACVPFEWIDADIDEVAIKKDARQRGEFADEIALLLARMKAECIAAQHPDVMVLGCDQILVCGGVIFDKPKDLGEARQHLSMFRGKSHQLISAMTLLVPGDAPWTYVDHANLTVRAFSDIFLDEYIESEGESILTSVGAYRLEGRGIQLFDDIVGNYFTILGLPLLPLLTKLRQRGGLDE